MEQTVEVEKHLEVGDKIRPFEKLAETRILGLELTTNPIPLDKIGTAIFRASSDIPKTIDVSKYHNPRVIWTEVELSPTLSEDVKAKWQRRLRLKIFLPNQTFLLARPKIVKGDEALKIIFNRWAIPERIKKLELSEELPYGENPNAVIVSAYDLSRLKFEFADSALPLDLANF